MTQIIRVEFVTQNEQEDSFAHLSIWLRGFGKNFRVDEKSANEQFFMISTF
jgi:hypothetical protein